MHTPGAAPTEARGPRERAARFSRGDLIGFALALGAVVLAAALSLGGAGAIPRFAASALALSLLARLVAESTDQLSHRLGPGATGVLQGALGNLPELLVCLFALRAGLVEVVRAALVGAILANSVLVLGLAILVGGLRNGTQRFASEAPRMIATLMLLAVTALAVPTLAHHLHTPAQAHEQTLSAVCAVALLVVFAASVPFSLSAEPASGAAAATDDLPGRAGPVAAKLRGHVVVDPVGVAVPGVAPVATHPGAEPAKWPLALALAVLAAAAIGAAFVSEWFVDALLPATRTLGLNETFTGLVIVAIAGNAVENVVGIQLAWRNRPDYAMSVILNSSLQIALALTPVLVLASFFIGPTPLTLVLSPLLVVALALSGIVGAFVVFDGESIWLEGVALLALYVMLATAFWWG